MRSRTGKKEYANKRTRTIFVLLCLVMIGAAGSRAAFAEWREPSRAPAFETFPAPLTTDSNNQAKPGFLMLDPSYNPTETTSLTFDPKRPLHVLGDGAKFSTPYVYGTVLNVNNNALYADAGSNNWVGLGTSTWVPGIKLVVANGTVRVGTEAVPITNSVAVSAYSSDSVGVYGDAGGTGTVGVYGLKTTTGGWAARGESANSSGVRGESVNGKGIDASTLSGSSAAVYGQSDQDGLAGYFDGRVGAGFDLVSNQFLPTWTSGRSLAPFTSGQDVAVYNSFGRWGVTTGAALAFDGSYLWAAMSRNDLDDKELFQIRPSDGIVVNSFDFAEYGYGGIIFDGTYLWLSAVWGSIIRFNPATGDYNKLNVGIDSGWAPERLAVGVTDGQRYIWTYRDSFVDANDSIIRINADTFAFDTYRISDFGLPAGSGNPNDVTYDGTYVWVALRSGLLLRMYADNPLDAAHPIVIMDTTTADYHCNPYRVFFDGAYVWCLPGSGANQILRIWPENPYPVADAQYDTRHPNLHFGPANIDYLKGAAFDGTYLWLVDHDEPLVYRLLAADPNQYVTFPLVYAGNTDPANRALFDGTYLWVPSESSNPPRLHKFFTGTGLGNTDLSSVVTLANQYAECRNNSDGSVVDLYKKCMSNLDCDTATQYCPIQIPKQNGYMNISGSAEVRNGHCWETNLSKERYDRACSTDGDCVDLTGGKCVGGNVRVGTDVNALGNQWSGTDETIAPGGVGQVANCATSGYFMRAVALDANSKISGIICTGL